MVLIRCLIFKVAIPILHFAKEITEMNFEIVNIVALMAIIDALFVSIDDLRNRKSNVFLLMFNSIALVVLSFWICEHRISIFTFVYSIISFIASFFPFYINEFNIQVQRKISINTIKYILIIIKYILIISMFSLVFAIVTFISKKATLSADIVTLITVIVAFLTAAYTTMKSNKSDLSAESLWREELMNVASKNKIERCDLLRLRASENYKYANKHNGDYELEKNYINAGYEVRDKIGKATNDLYNKYIFTESETVEISFEDQNTIRNLSIALLKYDYIKRGDNVKLTHYIIRELEEDDEYTNLLNWINKEIDVDKYNKYVL